MKSPKILILTLILTLGLSEYGYAIKPDRNYILTPDSVKWSYEELRIRTKDNFELNTWIYNPNSETD